MAIKQALLRILEENKGEVLSGEALAERLCVSRAAVWKAVKELQKEGHAIGAVTNRGYTLETTSDVLTAEGLLPYLARREVTVVAQPCLASTNLTAKELAAAGAPHGSIVAASQQTAGRGRRGRSFLSPPDTGLYLSVILRSDAPMSDGALITSAAAVAVCRALHRVCGIEDVQIKWVNDLYTHGKKCCGILTEAAADMETGGVDYIVVGIGLNLLLPEGGFLPELAEVATALFPAGAQVPRCRLAAEIVNELLRLGDALPDHSFLEEYRARNLVPGRDITIVQNGTQRPAHALSITDAGHLLVRLPDGRSEELSYGEISVRLQA
ncbi:MAG: biotin--[acetyl-CoA-carboxylase] ligase [Ruthenibacterium sp.]